MFEIHYNAGCRHKEIKHAGACPHKLSNRQLTGKKLNPSAVDILESWRTDNIAQVVYHSKLNVRGKKTLISIKKDFGDITLILCADIKISFGVVWSC